MPNLFDLLKKVVDRTTLREYTGSIFEGQYLLNELAFRCEFHLKAGGCRLKHFSLPCLRLGKAGMMPIEAKPLNYLAKCRGSGYAGSDLNTVS
jgi:hypothetical protein